MTKIVNGASAQPKSGGVPRQIILLLHGYGSNGADLISMAPHWQQALPDALFLAPNAPQRMGQGGGHQWWPLHGFSPQALASGASQAAPAIDGFLDRKLAQYGLSDGDLAIIGFSQGTMMALHVGLRRPAAPASIVGYSGMFVGAHALTSDAIVKPPVLLVHGSADPVVPVAALHAAKADLHRLGIDAQTHVSTGLGHSVDPVGLRLGAEFVAKHFAGR
ncbi:alpha/beta hydrolase [Polymorphobacter fuscus]|uniref:Phospholipase n=1 Tax=Sandarakinorhabdus fusca TaxID=1439888 RepID=A0A7C9KH30_9SPHN|nr:dienelactone hydrolase family protein [Polymorphobacter fuscus]KAB7648611.1 phospholipase [Polymorphobacter fuscus]MQT16161.1 phospholipase [Polymorphobacter fuscus]NJC07560.1 phospholipase/carboxylesterase [Polymorphobacter fuscus]